MLLKSSIPQSSLLLPTCLVGLMVKASTYIEIDPGSIPAFPMVFFPGRVIPEAERLVLQCLPCQAPDDMESRLGQVGLMSVYLEWVR